MTQFALQFTERPEGSQTMADGMRDAHNYYRWTMAQFVPFLGQQVLDIGGGFGSHLTYLLPHQGRITSVELSADCVAYMRQKFAHYPDFTALQVDFGAEDVAMLTARQFDTITCMNVLEHIEDDVAALRDMHGILAAQHGRLLLQVPAHAWLYGSLDAQAGHFRRYGRHEVMQKLMQTKFKIERVFYFNSFGVLPWFINARLLKVNINAGSTNAQVRLFDRWIVPVMSRLEAVIQPPIGQSVMAIAQAL